MSSPEKCEAVNLCGKPKNQAFPQSSGMNLKRQFRSDDPYEISHGGAVHLPAPGCRPVLRQNRPNALLRSLPESGGFLIHPSTFKNVIYFFGAGLFAQMLFMRKAVFRILLFGEIRTSSSRTGAPAPSLTLPCARMPALVPQGNGRENGNLRFMAPKR